MSSGDRKLAESYWRRSWGYESDNFYRKEFVVNAYMAGMRKQRAINRRNEDDKMVAAMSPEGVVRAYSGELVNVLHPMRGTIKMSDIAWSLGRTLRYNGHIKQDYTVAHHCLIMSYYVDEKFAMEALLHDAAEAYMGDILDPIKRLYPQIAKDEAKLTGEIMRIFAEDLTSHCVDRVGVYTRSKEVAEADRALFEHECLALGNRPGVYNGAMQVAWQKAIAGSNELWAAAQYPFLHRFHELRGTEATVAELNELAEVAWFSEQTPDLDDLDDDQTASIEAAAGELW